MAKKAGKSINPFIRILIGAVLVFAFYNSLSVLVLGIAGDTTSGVLDSYSNRLDNTSAGVNQSRTVSVTYHFSAGGRVYKGRSLYQSDEAWPSLSEGEVRKIRVKYLDILPLVNKPAVIADFDDIGAFGLIYHFIALPGCIILFMLANGWLGRKKKQRSRHPAGSGRTARTGYVSNVDSSSIQNREVYAMYCHNCGAGLPADAVFCASCGNPVGSGGQTADGGGPANVNQAAGGHSTVYDNPAANIDQNINVAAPGMYQPPPAQPAGLIGFSNRIYEPEIIAAARAERKSSAGCMWILVFVPLVGFLAAGLLIEEVPLTEAVIIGAALAFVMLIINLFALARSKKPIWEGTVIDRKSRKKRKQYRSDDNNSGTYKEYTEYTTVIRTDSGRKKTIVERDSERDMYSYFTVGDRIRYHPAFGTYEKYDKSRDRHIYCNVCRMKNPIANDRCKKCNNLLFK